MLLEIDCTPFLKYADKLGNVADQLPYALSRTLNAAVFNARRVLTEDLWVQSGLARRNPAWPSAALRVIPSTKQNLTAILTDVVGRGGLNILAKGGMETPLRGRAVSIPSYEIQKRKGARGTRKADMPSAIVASTPKRALRITQRGLFVGEHGRLRLKFSFKPSTTYRQWWPAATTFAEVVTTDMAAGFGNELAKALSTRR